ncbi:MAG TPA: methionyl-tRNA formyltransferase [Pyrinomonadaceae bacterium]
MKIVFMGTPQAAAVSLKRLISDGHEIVGVYTQPDRHSGRGRKVVYSPVKELALEHGLSLFQPTKVRTPEALEEFRSLSADLAVVVAYGRILPDGFLDAFPHRAINVHFSLLPKYRGAAPVNWAIVNGETETGVTTMKMDSGLDTGDILLQRSTMIAPSETSIALMVRLSQLGAELLSETLHGLASIEPRKQDDSRASLAPILKKEDGLIDWSLPVKKIERRIRGFQPFPSSYTFHDALRLTIWTACQATADASHPPGVILECTGDRLIVQCGRGTALAIQDIQPEGKRRMPVRDFLNGTKLTVGDTLGGPRSTAQSSMTSNSE